jgi:alpha-D-xyloside xylohydrolase
VLLHQSDPHTFAVKHAYQFGKEFLVAPMIEPNANARQVYLPEGNWFDFWTNARHLGGQTITWTNANQAQMPLFVREGAIVPMLSTDVQTLCDANYVNNAAIKTPDDGLQFLIYPAGTTQFTVHDGTNISCAASGSGVEVTLTSIARPIALKVFIAEPTEVTLGGAALPKLAPADFGTALSGWRFDQGFVFVKYQHIGGTAQIRF